MERIAHQLVQGSDQWAAFRLEHDGASEAAAMLGISKKVARSELLRMKHTGVPREFSEWVEKNVLAYGHEVEELARPIMEEVLDLIFYPATYSYGRLSASCDGLTMDGETAFEHKQANSELSAAVGRGELPDEHQPQCQQIMYVTGAKRVIFCVSDGTRENMVWMEVLPDEAWQQRIVAGWAQFHEDLKTYTPPEVLPAVVAAPVTDLPAVNVRVEGSITVVTNFDVFETALRDFIDTRLIREPQTDQDFVDLDAQIKSLKKAEALLESAESAMLAQVSAIDQAKRTKDMLYTLTRDNRLMAEKLLASEKDKRRAEIVQSGRDRFSAHIIALNEKFGKPLMPFIVADFAGAIKGKSKLDNMRDAIDTLLAAKKIEVNEIAGKIEANLKLLRDLAADHKALFADTDKLVLKDADAVEAIIKSRIADHQAEETRRLEAERARIRAEEEARAAAKVKAEQEEAARRQREQQEATAPVAAVVPIAHPAENDKTIKLGDINSLLGFTVTADFLAVLGFPARLDRNAKLYRECDLPAICAAIARHVDAIAATAMQKAA